MVTVADMSDMLPMIPDAAISVSCLNDGQYAVFRAGISVSLGARARL